MERKNSDSDDNIEGKLTMNQMKLKAQEIAKRYEKYQGRYQSSSSRSTTPLPLPITSADSMESICSNSVMSDTSEKVLLFRQFLENDRKLFENNKIDEQKYDSDDQANSEKLLDEQLIEKEKLNSTYYENIISAQMQEKNIHSLKNQIVELNEKLENYHNVINKKDVLLQSKIDKINSLNKTIMKKNKLHLETLEALKKSNVEVINEERLRCNQKINNIVEETNELRNNLEYVHHVCDELKKDNIKFDRENSELRRKEMHFKTEIENLSMCYDKEKKLLLKHNHETSKKIIDDMEKELLKFQKENKSLENKLLHFQQDSDSVEKELLHLRQENGSLGKELLKFQQENDLLEKEMSNYQQKNDFLEQKLKTVQLSVNDSLEKELLSSRQENSSLEKELSNYQQKNEFLEKELQNVQLSVSESLEKELLNLRQKNDLLEKEMLNCQQKNDFLEKELQNVQLSVNDSLEKELLSLRQENSSLEKELLNYQQKNEFLEKELQNVQLSISESLEKELLNLRQKNDLLEKEMLNCQQKNDFLEKELQNVQLSINDSSEKELQNVKLLNDSLEKELLNFQQKNGLLEKELQSIQENKGFKKNYVSSENNMNILEKDDLLAQLNMKQSEIQRLSLENENLVTQFQNQAMEAQQTENRWVQLKDAYLNDRDRMTFLEKVIDELKTNSDELSNANIRLTEEIVKEKEKTMENLTVLRTENSSYQERITDLMAVIENMRVQFEKAMKDALIEYEQDKKQLMRQHEDDAVLLTTCNNKFEENSSKLNEVTNQLDIVIKENNSYKCDRLELVNSLQKNNAQIFELNNIINELHKTNSQLTNELDFLKKENTKFSVKLNETNCVTEENKLFSDRFQKQKQLLKVKIKALKESENNRLLLQQQVVSLTDKIQALNLKSEYPCQSNEKSNYVLQCCDKELIKCHELLNTFIIKSNLQNQHMHTLRCVLLNLSSLFSFDDNSVTFDTDMLEIVNSICNGIPDDKELQICLKKMILGSIRTMEHTVNLNNSHKRSLAQLVAHTEVEKLVSEAVEKVKLSTQNEYHKQKNELHSLIENLQNENHALKLNNSSQTVEDKEVLTDLNGSTAASIFSSDINDIKYENDVLKHFLKNIRAKLGLINTNEQLRDSLSELEFLVQEIKNENKVLTEQYLEHQKLMNTLKQPVDQQFVKYQSTNTKDSFVQTDVDSLEENTSSDEKVSQTPDDLKQLHKMDETNSAIDSVAGVGDPKILLSRYKNLKSRFKEVRTKTVDLEKKITNLTKDLECANSKFKQLNDQFVNSNETHEADIAHCQSEIENLMSEKLEANSQLTALKEKHEILQNDYDQLKSNLDDKNTFSNIETTSTSCNEQNVALKGQLNDIQHVIDSAYSRVLLEWPTVDTNSDWVIVQSKKLDKIVDAKCNLSNTGFDLGESEVERLDSCVQIIRELVAPILTNECTIDETTTNVLVDLMTNLKSCTETYLEFFSIKTNKLHHFEHHIELPNYTEDNNDNSSSKQLLNSQKSSINEPSNLTEEPLKSSSLVKEENPQFQRAIAERDRLIEFLSEKISKLDNLSRNADDIKPIRDKLDRALTAVHERDVRCDELTLELTRLLEERDTLQLKLSNSIRQIQFLSNNKPQLGIPNFLEEKYDSKNIDDKLEELHSLEYRRDADLFANQEQRHMSQMQLHQNNTNSSISQESKSSTTSEEPSTSLSWFKDILW